MALLAQKSVFSFQLASRFFISVMMMLRMNSDSLPFDIYFGESTFTLTVRDISTKLI